jgi:hypothetical protein
LSDSWDELDNAGNYELVCHIRGKATLDELALGSFTRRSLKQLPIWDLWRASEWKQLDAHHKQEVPRCCVPIGTKSLSRVELVKLACAARIHAHCS